MLRRSPGEVCCGALLPFGSAPFPLPAPSARPSVKIWSDDVQHLLIPPFVDNSHLQIQSMANDMSREWSHGLLGPPASPHIRRLSLVLMSVNDSKWALKIDSYLPFLEKRLRSSLFQRPLGESSSIPIPRGCSFMKLQGQGLHGRKTEYAHVLYNSPGQVIDTGGD